MSIPVPEGNIEDWLNELKLYQRNTLKGILLSNEPEKAAEIWITSQGSDIIIHFGGTRDTKPFWDRFRQEFRNFICDDNAYKEEKKALNAEGSITKTLLISVVSSAIGATIGYSATLLAPAVAILLCVVGKMTVNAYCMSERGDR
jgi:hypothetical protein